MATAAMATGGSTMWDPSREVLAHITSWELLLKHVGLGEERARADGL